MERHTAELLNQLHHKNEGDLRVTVLISPAGTEGIVACRLLPDLPCLMHCRVHAGTLAVWLRSPVPDLPDCLIYHCQRALQED